MTEMGHLFIDACLGKPVDRTPVWLMRQAGRYMAEYRAIREKHDFWTVCRTPELACEVTMQPVDLIGVDAAILFSDILVVLPPMGCDVVFSPGPTLPHPVRTASDVHNLRLPDPVADLGYVLDAIGSIQRALGDRVPLIGFGGAPLTLAAYMVEGGGSKNFLHLKSLLYESPEVAGELLDMLVDIQARFLCAQIEAGAQAIQIFDTWGGLLSRDLYRAVVLERVAALVERVKRPGVPVIYFARDAAHLLDLLPSTGADVISVDDKLPLDRVAEILGPGPSIQGNMDSALLFGSTGSITSAVGRILEEVPENRGHVFNLGHGVLPGTPVQNVVHMVREVKRLSSAGGAR